MPSGSLVISHFIPDIGNLYLLFFLCQACKKFVNFIDLFKDKTCFIAFLYCFSVFSSIEFGPLLFPSFLLWVYFIFFLLQILDVEAQIIDLRLFLFSNGCFQFCKFPSQHCFCSFSQILICYIFIFLHFNVSFDLASDPSFTHELFRKMLFSFQVFGDFPVFFLLLIFSLIP